METQENESSNASQRQERGGSPDALAGADDFEAAPLDTDGLVTTAGVGDVGGGGDDDGPEARGWARVEPGEEQTAGAGGGEAVDGERLGEPFLAPVVSNDSESGWDRDQPGNGPPGIYASFPQDRIGTGVDNAHVQDLRDDFASQGEREKSAEETRSRKDNWVELKLRLTGGEYGLLREAEQVALEIMAMEGIRLPQSAQTRRRLALHRMTVEYLTEARWWLSEYLSRMSDYRMDALERMGKLEALRRDEYRCRLCGHTYANSEQISVQVHHIIPKGHPGDAQIKRPRDIHLPRNLISLCSRCHELAHRNWREAAVMFFRILHDKPMVELFEKHGYGAGAAQLLIDAKEKHRVMD